VEKVIIYTDGACQGNPGPGGWGCYFVFEDAKLELFGGCIDTTNNRMELQAAIEALKALKESFSVTLLSDSQYVIKGMTEWLANWKKKGWTTSSKKQVANRDLWEELDKLSQLHQVEWKWVKGHADDAGNIKADELANRGVYAALYA